MNGVTMAPDGFSLSLNTSVYSLDAIKKAAYKFADRASLMLDSGRDGRVSVNFRFPQGTAQGRREEILSDFCNELLDQDLREIVRRETEPLRNAIIAHAFSKTGLTKEA